MSRLLRLVLVLLLSLTLPLAGMAGVPSSSEPCPMKVADMQMMGDMSPDCCQDGVGHGKACKPGQECKTSGVLQLAVPLLKAPTPLAHPLAVNGAAAFIPDRTPSGVWRPHRG